MSTFERNHSSSNPFDPEMWHRLDEAQRDHRRQLLTYVAAIATAGILSFSLMIKLFVA